MFSEDLLSEVQDELGVDVYYVYQNERHFFLEAVLTAVTVACLLDYVKGLVQPKETGEAHRKYLRDLVAKVRAGQFDQEQRETEEQELDTLSRKLHTYTDEEAQQSVRELHTALTEIGMPPPRAEAHARRIADLADKEIKANILS